MKQILYWLVAGTRGGPTRARIIRILKDKPHNANQLARLLDLDYKTVKHHLEVLLENKIVITIGDKYGALYLLSDPMMNNYGLFEECSKGYI